jgi:acyl-coenzyme A thioesterase 9
MRHASIITKQLKHKILNTHRYFSKDDVLKGKVKTSSVEKTPITAQLWDGRVLKSKHADNIEDQVKEERVIIDKTPSDSRLSVTYDLSTDNNLRDLYINPAGSIRLGKLLEDLDAFAGNVASLHCKENNTKANPISLVTASVDSITQTREVSANRDMIMIGQVAYVGRTSLDIAIEIHSCADGNVMMPNLYENSNTLLLSSLFTFVARDYQTGRPALVNGLKTESRIEEEIYQKRLENARERKKAKTTTTPRCMEDLMNLVNCGQSIIDMPALAHPNAVLMHLTALENCFVCQPQNVNLAGRVFGGFLSK